MLTLKLQTLLQVVDFGLIFISKLINGVIYLCHGSLVEGSTTAMVGGVHAHWSSHCVLDDSSKLNLRVWELGSVTNERDLMRHSSGFV